MGQPERSEDYTENEGEAGIKITLCCTLRSARIMPDRIKMSEKLHVIYSSPNVIKLITPKRMRWTDM
jgi:hypothetical protein